MQSGSLDPICSEMQAKHLQSVETELSIKVMPTVKQGVANDAVLINEKGCIPRGLCETVSDVSPGMQRD